VGRANKRGKCLAHRARVLSADVDFVRRSVHRKRNGFVGLGFVAVHIANQENLHSLRHCQATTQLVAETFAGYLCHAIHNDNVKLTGKSIPGLSWPLFDPVDCHDFGK
jgi:hypothetical protein